MPAAVAAGPANSAIEETWLAGYAIVHCRPAGDVVDPVRLTLRVTVPPGTVFPEEILRVPACPSRVPCERKNSAIAMGKHVYDKRAPRRVIVLL